MTQFQLVCTLLIVVCTISCVMNATVERYFAELQNGKDGNKMSDAKYLTCVCGNSTDVSESLNEEMASAVLKGELKMSHCRKSHVHKICSLLFSCTGCMVRQWNCHVSKKEEKSQCLREIHLLNENYFGLRDRHMKDIITIEPVRVKRQSNACTYPSNLKTADVVCQTSGPKVTCTQACIFGHTLKEGVVKSLECDKRQNVWQPSGFVECEPFIDCSLSLTSPGSVDCFSGTTRTAPVCYVRCDHYEDRAAIPKKAFECTLSGGWTQPLPFCVTTGSGLNLVPKPSNYQPNQRY